MRPPSSARALWASERWEAQAAYIVPPVAATRIICGPSGFDFYPGTGLPSRYAGHFLLCNFGYIGSASAVYSVAMVPHGASFTMTPPEVFAGGIIPTDVTFANDGGAYVAAFEEGGRTDGRGRVYRVFDPSPDAGRAAREVAAILGRGMDGRPAEELAQLLGHGDARVRREAQFALAERGERRALTAAAARANPRLARIHAIWGLGQLARACRGPLPEVIGLLDDPDEEIRAQAAKTLGDAREGGAAGRLIGRLGDTSARARMYAAIALGRLRRPEAAGPLLEMLRRDVERDPVLRHAAVMGLVGCADPGILSAARADGSVAVRLGAVVALRRLKSTEVTSFLDDSDPRVVLEAARAINDVPIPTAIPSLAAIADRPALPDPTLRRALNARAIVGRPEDARAVAHVAARPDVAISVRLMAMQSLLDWTDTPPFDLVTGYWRPAQQRPADGVVEAIRPVLGVLLDDPQEGLRTAAIRIVGRYAIAECGPELSRLAGDPRFSAEVRAEAMATLLGLGDPRVASAVESALSDPDEELRAAVIPLLPQSHEPDRAIDLLKSRLEVGSLSLQQAAWHTLGQIPGDAADALIARGLERLIAGRFPPGASLELVEAARKRSDPGCREILRRYEESKPAGDLVARRGESMVGGSSARGREVFNRTGEMACLRCHSVGVMARGGAIGPDLARLGWRLDRRAILESLVDPSRKIVDGYAMTTMNLADGRVVSGVVVESTPERITLALTDGGRLDVPVDQIEERASGRSAMPDDIVATLPDGDLRDLMAYLSGLGSEYSSSSRFLRLQDRFPRRERPDFFHVGHR